MLQIPLASIPWFQRNSPAQIFFNVSRLPTVHGTIQRNAFPAVLNILPRPIYSASGLDLLSGELRMDSKNNVSQRMHRNCLCVGDRDVKLLLQRLHDLDIGKRIEFPKEV